jgi:hypothetical protein
MRALTFLSCSANSSASFTMRSISSWERRPAQSDKQEEGAQLSGATMVTHGAQTVNKNAGRCMGAASSYSTKHVDLQLTKTAAQAPTLIVCDGDLLGLAAALVNRRHVQDACGTPSNKRSRREYQKRSGDDRCT